MERFVGVQGSDVGPEVQRRDAPVTASRPHDGALARAVDSASGSDVRLSVVMIFMDVRDYLDEAIASVLRQTVPDLELILVDDGSRDGSGDLAAAWARRDARVRVLGHPGGGNRGMAASRAVGVRAARGPWVAFLDGDDVWRPDHVARQLELTARHPDAGLVVSPATIWTSWRGDGVADHVRELPYPADVTLPRGALLDATTFDGAPVPTCGLMFRRALAPDAPGDPGFPGLFEDQTAVARLTVATPAVVAPTSTALYRQRPGSAVHSAPGRGGRDPVTLRYLDWIDSFLARHDAWTPERQARLEGKRAEFDPRWRFWLWYGARWSVQRLLNERGRRTLRDGRALLRRVRQGSSRHPAGRAPVDLRPEPGPGAPPLAGSPTVAPPTVGTPAPGADAG